MPNRRGLIMLIPPTVSSPRAPSPRYVEAARSPSHPYLPNRVPPTITSTPSIATPTLSIKSIADTNTPTGLRPHCLRELRRRCRGGWQACRTSAVGYGWPRRLRPPQTSLIPRLPRHPHLFRCRLARLARQCAREGTMKCHVLHKPHATMLTPCQL